MQIESNRAATCCSGAFRPSGFIVKLAGEQFRSRLLSSLAVCVQTCAQSRSIHFETSRAMIAIASNNYVDWGPHSITSNGLVHGKCALCAFTGRIIMVFFSFAACKSPNAPQMCHSMDLSAIAIGSILYLAKWTLPTSTIRHEQSAGTGREEKYNSIT